MHLKQSIKQLATIHGRHTACISLYVPSARKISETLAYLRNEINESGNIKDKTNRIDVTDNIFRLIEWLRLNPKLPNNGIALFSFDGEIYHVDPPQVITSFRYVCGSEFWLDPLHAMSEDTTIIGLLVMDNREATIGILRGTTIEILETLQSGIVSKQGQGGMSQNRFLHLHGEMARFFYKEVAEAVNRIWLEYPTLTGILIGGSGLSKNEFVAENLLDYQLRPKILAINDTGYTDYQGLKELLSKSSSVIHDLAYIRQKHIWDQFLEGISIESNKVMYGKKEVLADLQLGKVDTLLLSEDCADVIQDEWQQAIAQFHPKIIVLANDSEDGSAFRITFGGIGAILRFA